MKELKVRFWAARNKWNIDARRIGLSGRYGSFDTEQEARLVANELLAKNTLGILEAPTKQMTAGDMVNNFLAYQTQLHDAGDIGKASLDNIKRAMTRLKATKIDGTSFVKVELGKVCTRENKAQLALQITNALRVRGKARTTMKSWFIHSKHFFNHCVERGYIDVNPLAQVAFTFDGEAVEDEIAPMVQTSTVKKVLAALDEETLRSKALIWLAAETGMRQGELRALRLCDIDRSEGVIRVTGAIKSGTLERGTTKTKYGKRTIAYGEGFAKLLPELLISLQYRGEEDYLFQTASGLPMSKKTIHNLIVRLRNRAGVDFNFKALRHAYATMQLNGLKGDSHHAAKLLGHHNSKFTEDVYGHVLADKKKTEASRSVINEYLHG